MNCPPGPAAEGLAGKSPGSVLLPGRHQFLYKQVPIQPLGQFLVIAPDREPDAGREWTGPTACPERGPAPVSITARVWGGLFPGRHQFLHQQVPIQPLGQFLVIAPDPRDDGGSRTGRP